MAQLSSTGTWSPLATNLVPMQDINVGSQLVAFNIAPADLLNPPDEVRQLIRLAQDGWGGLIGSGNRLGYYATVVLLREFFTAYGNLGTPRPLGGP
jgi:hypothetical protein